MKITSKTPQEKSADRQGSTVIGVTLVAMVAMVVIYSGFVAS
jgi:hypothetical protein